MLYIGSIRTLGVSVKEGIALHATTHGHCLKSCTEMAYQPIAGGRPSFIDKRKNGEVIVLPLGAMASVWLQSVG